MCMAISARSYSLQQGGMLPVCRALVSKGEHRQNGTACLTPCKKKKKKDRKPQHDSHPPLACLLSLLPRDRGEAHLCQATSDCFFLRFARTPQAESISTRLIRKDIKMTSVMMKTTSSMNSTPRCLV